MKRRKVMPSQLAFFCPIVIPRLRDPRSVFDGIYLGRFIGKGTPYCWNPLAEQNQHLVCVGMSGSGKSTTVRTITFWLNVIFRVPGVLLDWTGADFVEMTRTLGGHVLSAESDIRLPFDGRLICVNLGTEINPEERARIALDAIRQVYDYAYTLPASEESRLMMFVVVDEAHNYRDDKGRVLARAMKELRKYGVALIISTQDLGDVAVECISNPATAIVHCITQPDYLDVLREKLSLTRDEVREVKSLGRGEALIKTQNRPACLIKVDAVLPDDLERWKHVKG